MAFHNNPRIVTNGLVLCLDANAVSSYPGSGTTWYDISGNGYNFTLTNGTSYSSDANGSFYFDGTDDSIQGSSNTNTRLANTIQTISIFAYIRSVGPNTYAEIYHVGGNGYHLVKWMPSGVSIAISSYFYSNVISVSNAYNEWMDITCVIDWSNDIFKLYKNGSFVNSTGIVPTTYAYGNPTVVAIGDNNSTGNTGDFLKGSIGPVRIYNRELAASEVLQNYNAQKSRFGI
jgi:hypothetical protein